jgi:predicted 3-demethylubiquinone-9 3-methyltransferase (glyoxalase superfamily)
MNNTIYPSIWFDSNAKEAAELYITVFNNSKILNDSPMVVNCELSEQKFMFINGGPMFRPNPSISFFVVFETLEEIENANRILGDGGKVLMPLDKYEWSERYVWLEDKFGVNWQLSYGKLNEVGQVFSPTLMFTGEQHPKAEEAINFYTKVFPNSSIAGILRYSENDEDIEGTVKHAMYKLNNYVFMAMDSSYPHKFSFSEGISFVVECNSQEEIDYYWEKLTEGGSESMCGWLKDKYGLSWQIIPSVLGELMADAERAPRVINAFMQMKKFDIQKILDA